VKLNTLLMDSKMHAGALQQLYQRARELRNNATYAEEILWGYLRTKPLGYKFRRQHPYSIYILDFYCHSKRLVIEVDGNIHNQEDIKALDEYRQKQMEADGLKVIRFTNEQIKIQLDFVVRAIEEVLADPA
jgi:imidazole glycerol-phosphate synthase subunit HisF